MMSSLQHSKPMFLAIWLDTFIGSNDHYNNALSIVSAITMPLNATKCNLPQYPYMGIVNQTSMDVV